MIGMDVFVGRVFVHVCSCFLLYVLVHEGICVYLGKKGIFNGCSLGRRAYGIERTDGFWMDGRCEMDIGVDVFFYDGDGGGIHSGGEWRYYAYGLFCEIYILCLVS